MTGGKIDGEMGGFSPPQVAGINTWIDASDEKTYVFRPGSTIYLQGINDKSGNGHHATQSTEGSQPTLLYNHLNGRNVVYFPSYGKQLNFANGSFPYLDSSYTYFLVIKVSADSTHPFIACGTNGLERRFFLWFYQGRFQHDWYGDTLTGELESPNTWYLCNANYDGTTRQSILDGGTIYSDVPGVPCENTGQNIMIGAGTGSRSVHYAELIIYDRKVSDNQRKQIERYLSAKWDITI